MKQMGQITFELLSSTSRNSYTLSSDVSKNSASVTVLDNDIQPQLPVISIAPVVSSVDESDPAQFRITTSVVATSEIAVNVNVSQSGNVLAGTSGSRTVIISPTSTEATLEIDTDDDLISEPDGVITVSLVTDDITPATYTITPVSANQSAQVTVIDDEPLPRLNINSAGVVLEPNVARFRLSTDTASSEPLTVRIDVRQFGSVLSGSGGESTIIMPAGEYETYYEIPTEDDEVAEYNGAIRVTLLPDNQTSLTYTVPIHTTRSTSARVKVYDDDTIPIITIADATAGS